MGKLQNRFQRSGKSVDAELRRRFAPPPLASELTEEQRSILRSCEELDGGARGWEPIRSKDFPLVEMYRKVSGDRVAFGRAEGLIDCGALEAMAWHHPFCSRQKVKDSIEGKNRARLSECASEARAENKKQDGSTQTESL
jgi:hypothetical protein